MSVKTFNIIVIGAGPGGYVAAIRAAQLGQKVAIIEANHLGGICLNWGCIPTKALLRSSEIYHLLQHAEEFGFNKSKIEVNLAKIVGRSRAVSQQLSLGIKHLMKKNNIEVFNGFGSFLGKEKNLHKIQITHQGSPGEQILAPHVIVATGSRARILPDLEPDGTRVWTYKEAMTPEVLPKSLLVIGSGAIGIEFASFYNALNVDVTVIETLERILPIEDEEISGFAHKAFEKRGIKIMTGTTVQKLDKEPQKLIAHLQAKESKRTLEIEKVILAVGIIGNTETLGLENTKVKVEKNQITTHEGGETDEPGVYAIGDVAGAPWLAHKASHEGVLAVEHIMKLPKLHPLKRSNIPGCIYSAPQIASIGLTEQKAREAGFDIKIGRFPYLGNGKAIALGETEGLIKTIFEAKTGELLGAHMVGAEVTELIQGFSIAKTLEATELELMQTIFPHPTLSEMMHESTLNAFGRAIHI